MKEEVGLAITLLPTGGSPLPTTEPGLMWVVVVFVDLERHGEEIGPVGLIGADHAPERRWTGWSTRRVPFSNFRPAWMKQPAAHWQCAENPFFLEFFFTARRFIKAPPRPTSTNIFFGVVVGPPPSPRYY